jgi:hypothetical protein
MASSKRGLGVRGADVPSTRFLRRHHRLRRWIQVAAKEAQRLSEHGFRAFIT